MWWHCMCTLMVSPLNVWKSFTFYTLQQSQSHHINEHTLFESIYNNGYCNIPAMCDVNNVLVANNIRLFGIPQWDRLWKLIYIPFASIFSSNEPFLKYHRGFLKSHRLNWKIHVSDWKARRFFSTAGKAYLLQTHKCDVATLVKIKREKNKQQWCRHTFDK